MKNFPIFLSGILFSFISCTSYTSVGIKNERHESVFVFIGEEINGIETFKENEKVKLVDTLSKSFVFLEEQESFLLGKAIDELNDFEVYIDTLVVLSSKLDTLDVQYGQKKLLDKFSEDFKTGYYYTIK